MQKFFLILGLIFIIGLLSILVTLYRTKLTAIPGDYYQIKVNAYSMSFYSSDLKQRLFSISPYDDYYYDGLYKDHFVNQNSFKESKDFSKSPIWILKALLTQKQYVVWTAYGKNGSSIEYQVINSPGGEIEIIREAKNVSHNPDSIGQSIVYCESCIIVDQNKRVFFSSEEFSREKVDFANSLGLTPVVLSGELLPSDVTKVSLLDLNGNLKVTIPINNQQAFLNKKWRILEIKFPRPTNKAITSSQTIKFEK